METVADTIKANDAETEAAAAQQPAADIPEYGIALEHWYGEAVEEETAEETAAERSGTEPGPDHHEGPLRPDDGH